MPRKPPANLRVIATRAQESTSVLPTPPGQLGAVGLSLWNDIAAAYEFNDRASYETLYQACASADRAEEIARRISKDGVLIRSRGVMRDNPLIKHELAARAFVCRSLQRLGLDLEPVRDGPGRPGGSRVGISFRKGGLPPDRF
jgi:hypothetical protein